MLRMLPQAATEDDVRAPRVPGQVAEQEARLGLLQGPQLLPYPQPQHLSSLLPTSFCPPALIRPLGRPCCLLVWKGGVLDRLTWPRGCGGGWGREQSIPSAHSTGHPSILQMSIKGQMLTSPSARYFWWQR